MKEIEIPTLVMPIQKSIEHSPPRILHQEAPVADDAIKPVTSVLAEPIEKDSIQIDPKVTNEDSFFKDEGQEVLPVRRLEEIRPEYMSIPHTEIISEEETGEEKLEEDFKTLEAQRAYYEFMEAVRLVDIKSGRGGERLIDAMEGVKIYAKDMSINKLLSIMIVSIPLLLEAWGEKTKRDESHAEEEKTVIRPVEEKNEDTSEKRLNPIVLNPFDLYVSEKPHLAA